MRLDRNTKNRGKYGLILNRELERLDQNYDTYRANVVRTAITVLEAAGIIDWADTPETEAFVLRLKDRFAPNALYAYGIGAESCGEVEYGKEVIELAKRAAVHPNSKTPD